MPSSTPIASLKSLSDSNAWQRSTRTAGVSYKCGQRCRRIWLTVCSAKDAAPADDVRRGWLSTASSACSVRRWHGVRCCKTLSNTSMGDGASGCSSNASRSTEPRSR
ncbi:hypothetical protein DQ04_12271030 [Trypanosoma grayi]|uniref:hypothetical protein n=1 Tax=Trypanosoma grayi TaxID=71804 RepID=UPI0004F46F32|nr:hypothetical protein DQ04_12271030 [Trypanosoma grayi]KEG06783.1 hypothetical protein DQ04_12271030 [Trypanosoma grayi]